MPNQTESSCKPTEVCITIDTEFSIGGTFRFPDTKHPVGPENVYCPADGNDNGLPFLLRIFAEYDIEATFFVEALQTAYFGDAPMGRIVEEILNAGQDVQLHIHPCWRYFRHQDWRERLKTADRPNDSCAGRSLAELNDALGAGLDTFHRWGAPRPVAVRTGNLQADHITFRAILENNIRLSSNLGIGSVWPDEDELQIFSGAQEIEGVLEVPVTTYRQWWFPSPTFRALTLAGTAWLEIEALLRNARAQNISPVVILTHPFEFIRGGRPGYHRIEPNRVNQQRLIKLCRFLAAGRSEFRPISLGGAAKHWLLNQPTANGPLHVSLPRAAYRMMENKLNERKSVKLAL